MPREIELKLALPVSARRAFLRHPVLKEAVAVKPTQRLVNIYFDTPDLKFNKQRMALRLRKQGRQWLQTVKCAGVVSGGLASRPEWEQPYNGHAFDFAAVDVKEVRKSLEKARDEGSLRPAFETNFQRRTWVFEPAPGSRLLLVLDEGEIKAGNQVETLCELEIEIAGGDTGPLFELALKLAERLPLRPDDRSKSERGYRLFTGEALAPRHGSSSPISGTDTPRIAFLKTALSCMVHLQANEAGMLATAEPEFIHQMRVALRRLRSALRVFSPALPTGFRERFDGRLADIADALGAARDWDVVVESILAEARKGADDSRLDALVSRAEAARQTARQAARQCIAAPEYGRLLLELVAALHGPDFGQEGSDADLPAFARRQLADLRRRLARRADRAASLDPTELHNLRIAGKRLRYAREFFAPLKPGKAVRQELDRLADLQTRLGHLNDDAVARRLLNPLADQEPDLRAALGLVEEWQQLKLAPLMAELPGLLADFKKS